MDKKQLDLKLKELEKDIDQIDSLIEGVKTAFAQTSTKRKTVSIEDLETQYHILETIKTAMKKAYDLKDQLGKVGEEIGVKDAGYYIERALSRFKIQEQEAWKALSQASEKVLPQMLKDAGSVLLNTIRPELPSHILVVPDQYVALSKDNVYYGYYLYVYQSGANYEEYLNISIATKVNRSNPEKPTDLRYISFNPTEFKMPDVVYSEGKVVASGKEAGKLALDDMKDIPDLSNIQSASVGKQIKPIFEKWKDRLLSDFSVLCKNVEFESRITDKGFELQIITKNETNLTNVRLKDTIAYNKAVKNSIKKMEDRGNPLPSGLVDDTLKKILYPYDILVSITNELKKSFDNEGIVITQWTIYVILTK